MDEWMVGERQGGGGKERRKDGRVDDGWTDG
jgi:hypothetical protein